jgi:hypothetical protein
MAARLSPSLVPGVPGILAGRAKSGSVARQVNFSSSNLNFPPPSLLISQLSSQLYTSRVGTSRLKRHCYVVIATALDRANVDRALPGSRDRTIGWVSSTQTIRASSFRGPGSRKCQSSNSGKATPGEKKTLSWQISPYRPITPAQHSSPKVFWNNTKNLCHALFQSSKRINAKKGM